MNVKRPALAAALVALSAVAAMWLFGGNLTGSDPKVSAAGTDVTSVSCADLYLHSLQQPIASATKHPLGSPPDLGLDPLHVAGSISRTDHNAIKGASTIDLTSVAYNLAIPGVIGGEALTVPKCARVDKTIATVDLIVAQGPPVKVEVTKVGPNPPPVVSQVVYWDTANAGLRGYYHVDAVNPGPPQKLTLTRIRDGLCNDEPVLPAAEPGVLRQCAPHNKGLAPPPLSRYLIVGIKAGDRPTSTGTFAGGILTTTQCEFSEAAPTDPLNQNNWTRTEVRTVVNNDTSDKTPSYGEVSLFNPTHAKTCANILPGGNDGAQTFPIGTRQSSLASVAWPLDAIALGDTKATFNSDYDKDGCRDWDELANPPVCGRDPWNPLDADSNFYSTWGMIITETAATHCQLGAPAPVCMGQPDGTLVFGAYSHCIADSQQGGGGPTTVNMRIYCYNDNPSLNVNNHSPGAGDGFLGAKIGPYFGQGVPPAPYGEVHASHTQLSGSIGALNVMSLTGCFGNSTTDPRGAPHDTRGYQYWVLSVDGDTGHGTVNIYTGQNANCAGSPTGTPITAEVQAVEQPKGNDTDLDNCSDKEELADNGQVGGLRDPLNWGDFMSVHTGPTLVKDKSVSIGDISAIVPRFGLNDANGTATINRNTDPKSTPPATGYHPSYDRGGAIANGNVPGSVSRQLPANAGSGAGSISIGDISAAVAQFGHNCVAAP